MPDNKIKPKYFVFSGNLIASVALIRLDLDHPSLAISEYYEEYDSARQENWGPIMYSMN